MASEQKPSAIAQLLLVCTVAAQERWREIEQAYETLSDAGIE